MDRTSTKKTDYLFVVRLQWFRCCEEKAILENKYISFCGEAPKNRHIEIILFNPHSGRLKCVNCKQKSHIRHMAYGLLCHDIYHFYWKFYEFLYCDRQQAIQRRTMFVVKQSHIALKYNLICEICVIFSMN